MTIDHIYMRRYLHIPTLILNPMNGSFRFVVCGIKDWEAMAYSEVINVYDKCIWGMWAVTLACAALVWRLLLLSGPQSSQSHDHNSHGIDVLSKTYSLLKILLEQGDLDYDSPTIFSQKVLAFLGIILLMPIILSNGYKNANVYNMITPLKPLRYEHFDDLIAGNLSIFGSSKAQSDNLWTRTSGNWFVENASMTKLHDDSSSYTYYYTVPLMKYMLSVSSRMGNPPL